MWRKWWLIIWHIHVAVSLFARAPAYDHVKILTVTISSGSEQPSQWLYNPPFVPPNQLAAQPRLVHFPGLIKEPFTVLSPVSPEKIWSIDKFVLASSYLETNEKGIPRQSWTELLNTDYIRGDKGRYSLKFQSSTLTQGFCIGSWHNHVTKPLTWVMRWRILSTFQEPDQKEVDMWELQHVENLGQFPWNRGFLVKGGGMDGAIYQGTAGIHPTCLDACARTIRRKEDLSIR